MAASHSSIVSRMKSRLRGACRQQARARTSRLLTALDIEKWQAVPGERLSGGVRRLTAFCLAAVHPGRVVMLDEPSNDVDPVRRRLLWEQVRALAGEGCAVLLVTHNVAEAERSVDRLAVLQHGRIAATGTPAQLRAHAGGDLRLELATCGSHLPEAPFAVGQPSQDRQRTVIPIAANAASLAVRWAQRLRDHDVIREFSLVPVSLEDAYLQLSGHSSPAGDQPGSNHPSPRQPYPSGTKED
jgi:ABC-2 type transport system ATP-binding protein